MVEHFSNCLRFNLTFNTASPLKIREHTFYKKLSQTRTEGVNYPSSQDAKNRREPQNNNILTPQYSQRVSTSAEAHTAIHSHSAQAPSSELTQVNATHTLVGLVKPVQTFATHPTTTDPQTSFKPSSTGKKAITGLVLPHPANNLIRPPLDWQIPNRLPTMKISAHRSRAQRFGRPCNCPPQICLKMHTSLQIKILLPNPLLTLTIGCGRLPDEVVDRNHKNARGETVLLALNRYTTDNTLTILPSIPSTETLTLDNSKTSDAGMAHVADLPNLQMLALNGTNVTDAAFNDLAKLTKLNHLELRETNIPDAAISTIKTFKDLKILNLERTAITDEGLRELAEMRQLQGLVLNGTDVTDAGIAHLSNLTGLDSLRLNDTGITDAAIESLRDSKTITELQLENTQVTDKSTDVLTQYSELAYLNLNGTGITSETLLALATMEKLQYVFFTDTDTSPAAQARWSKHPTLNLSDAKNTDEQLVFAEGTTTLDSVSLVNSDLTDAGIKSLATLPKLRRLSLEGTKVTDAGLGELCNIETLEFVDLSNTAITEKGLAQLNKLTKLKSLFLSDGQLSSEGKDKLHDAIPSLRFC